jgi:hypothetical protein
MLFISLNIKLKVMKAATLLSVVLLGISVLVSASAEQSILRCNTALARHAFILEFDKRAAERGGWICGNPERAARMEVAQACRTH